MDVGMSPPVHLQGHGGGGDGDRCVSADSVMLVTHSFLQTRSEVGAGMRPLLQMKKLRMSL